MTYEELASWNHGGGIKVLCHHSCYCILLLPIGSPGNWPQAETSQHHNRLSQHWRGLCSLRWPRQSLCQRSSQTTLLACLLASQLSRSELCQNRARHLSLMDAELSSLSFPKDSGILGSGCLSFFKSQSESADYFFPLQLTYLLTGLRTALSSAPNTKYHRPGDLNNRDLFSHGSGGLRSRHHAGLWWDLSSSFAESHLLAVSSHSEESALVSPSHKRTNPTTWVPPPWPHLNFITSQSLYLQTLSHWGLALQYLIFGWERHNSVDSNSYLIIF